MGAALGCDRRKSPEEKPEEKPLNGKGEQAEPAKPKAEAAKPKAEDVPEKTDVEKLKDLGNAAFKKRDFEQALEAYKKASELDPKDASLWLNRSIACRQMQRWKESLEDATRATALQPLLTKAVYGRAYALQQLGRLYDAKDICNVGLKDSPESKPLLQLQKAIEEQLNPKKPSLAQVLAAAGPNGGGDCPVTKKAESSRVMEFFKPDGSPWEGRNPGKAEREHIRGSLVDDFRKKYAAHRQTQKEGGSVLSLEQYDEAQKAGLYIEGGHQPVDRPEGVVLPKNYRQPLGILTPEELETYNHLNKDGRHLCSVWGKLYDCSDRPDKYGADGIYENLSGRDITWGLFNGIDHPELTNQFYDLFKAPKEHMTKLAGVCSWLAFYEQEYGEPVGTLRPFVDEWDLPPGPVDLGDPCCIQ